MTCKDCQEKDLVIAKLERILAKAQACNEEKYHRIKRLEDATHTDGLKCEFCGSEVDHIRCYECRYADAE